MTKKMPTHIKENFIYKKIWTDVHINKKNSNLLFIGDVGSGKSTSALKFAEQLDPKFSVDRVCFSVQELMKLLDDGDKYGKLKKGSVVILDEASGSEDNVDSRSFMSKENKIMGFVSTVIRARNLVVIYCAPFMHQIDKRIRQIGLTGILVFKKVHHDLKCAEAVFYWSNPSALYGKVYTPKPRLILESGEKILIDKIFVDAPSSEIMKEYESKKMQFISDNVHKWRMDLEQAKEEKKEENQYGINKLKDIYDKVKLNSKEYQNEKQDFSSMLIEFKLGCSRRHAQVIATNLNLEKKLKNNLTP